jgi:SAM-dependent methyltransferase
MTRLHQRDEVMSLLACPGEWTPEAALAELRLAAALGSPEPEFYARLVRWLRRDLRPVARSAARADALYAAVARGEQASEPGFLSGVQAARKVGYGPLLVGVGVEVARRFLGLGCPWNAVRPSVGDNVVDLGCGGGLDVLLAASMVGPSGRVVGVDSRGTLLPAARLLPAHARTVIRDASDTGIPEGWASLVTANGLPQLITGETEASTLSEVRRVLADGGTFVMTALVADTPGPTLEADSLVTAVRTGKPFPAQVRRMLEKEGFRTVAGRLGDPPLSDHPCRSVLRSGVFVARVSA